MLQTRELQLRGLERRGVGLQHRGHVQCCQVLCSTAHMRHHSHTALLLPQVRLLMCYSATHVEKLDATRQQQWQKVARLTPADMDAITNLEYLGVPGTWGNKMTGRCLGASSLGPAACLTSRPARRSGPLPVAECSGPAPPTPVCSAQAQQGRAQR